MHHNTQGLNSRRVDIHVSIVLHEVLEADKLALEPERGPAAGGHSVRGTLRCGSPMAISPRAIATKRFLTSANSPGVSAVGGEHRCEETAIRSKPLFFRNSGRRTGFTLLLELLQAADRLECPGCPERSGTPKKSVRRARRGLPRPRLPHYKPARALRPSSSGQGRRPFTAETRVRVRWACQKYRVRTIA